MGKTIENLFIHVRAIRRLTISQSDRAARSIADHMRIKWKYSPPSKRKWHRDACLVKLSPQTVSAPRLEILTPPPDRIKSHFEAIAKNARPYHSV